MIKRVNSSRGQNNPIYLCLNAESQNTWIKSYGTEKGNRENPQDTHMQQSAK